MFTCIAEYSQNKLLTIQGFTVNVEADANPMLVYRF